jgi:excisionase family DNA binding protein
MTATPRTERAGEHARTPDLAIDRRPEVIGDEAEAPTDASMVAGPQVRLVSVDAAAQLLGVGRTTVYDLINRGALRSLKIGRRTLLPVDGIDSFVGRKLASA